MSKRKILMLALSLCMVAILAVGGTLAYFTDDEQATNTFTIGNVQIDIEELVKQEDGTYKPFVDDEFTMYPVGSDVATRQNKVVFTFNTSKVNAADKESGKAYIRTIILFEANDKLPADFQNEATCCDPLKGLHFSYTTVGGTMAGKTYHGSNNVFLPETVEIDDSGVKYWVAIFTEANEEAIPSGEAMLAMHSVWMDKNVTLQQAEGWGEKVDIIVYSQGIQAEGLTHAQAMDALGEVTEDNLKVWLDGDDATINNIF